MPHDSAPAPLAVAGAEPPPAVRASRPQTVAPHRLRPPRDEAADDAPAQTLGQIWTRFWPDTRGSRRLLVGATAVGLVAVPLETATIWLFKSLVDDVLTPADFAPFPRLAVAFLALTLLLGVVAFVERELMTRASQDFLLRLRARVLTHLYRLSMEFFDRRRTGDLLSRVTGDVAAIEALLLAAVSSVLTDVLRIAVFGTMMVVVDPLLAAVALVVAPLMWLTSRVFSPRLKATARESRRRSGAVASVVEEGLGSVALVQAYNRQGDEVGRFLRQARLGRDAALATARIRSLYGPVIDVIELAGVLLVFGVGTYRLGQGEVTLGGLLVFLAYFSQTSAPIRSLARLGTTLYAAAAGAERIVEVLRTRPQVVEPVAPLPAPDGPLGVELRDVTFRYPGRRRRALAGVSLVVAPGETVAVVGPSGSGKSTLGKLLLRFHDPDEGTVRVGGVNVRAVSLADLRDRVAVVLQDTVVHEGTVRENVLWGRPGATDAEVDAALAAADVTGFLEDLPDGADSLVGHRGRRLSGGQRQRVAVARAMVRDAPVLLLDEPATGLDAESERRVLVALRRLMAGRTTLLVTHNLRAAREADRVVVLERGRVVETGRHEDLVAAHGTYHRMWLAQGLDDPATGPTTEEDG